MLPGWHTHDWLVLCGSGGGSEQSWPIGAAAAPMKCWIQRRHVILPTPAQLRIVLSVKEYWITTLCVLCKVVFQWGDWPILETRSGTRWILVWTGWTILKNNDACCAKQLNHKSDPTETQFYKYIMNNCHITKALILAPGHISSSLFPISYTVDLPMYFKAVVYRQALLFLRTQQLINHKMPQFSMQLFQQPLHLAIIEGNAEKR